MYKKQLLYIITIIFTSKSYGYVFYYDNVNELLFFSSLKNDINKSLSFIEDDFFQNSIKTNEYYSGSSHEKFLMEYYSCNIPNISSSKIFLIKISFNITYPIRKTIKEVIIDYHDSIEELLIFPEEKYKNEFTIEARKDNSYQGSKNRGTKIYDTFGFNIKSRNNIKFKIIKLLLITYKKNKLIYLADLTRNVEYTYGKDKNEFDIYLKNLPENFDLYINLNVIEDGEKILIVKKGFEHPNFGMEKNNPNENMAITSITSIIITFFLIIIFIILIFTCNCF